MSFTRDNLCSLVKNWHSLIEAWVDVKTTDGFVFRLFCIAFTKKRRNQMKEIMTAEASKSDLKTLFKQFIPEFIGKEIEKSCNGIYPLKDVYIRKAKVLKKPKFDLAKLMEVHEGGSLTGDDIGAKIDRDEADEDVVAGTGG